MRWDCILRGLTFIRSPHGARYVSIDLSRRAPAIENYVGKWMHPRVLAADRVFAPMPVLVRASPCARSCWAKLPAAAIRFRSTGGCRFARNSCRRAACFMLRPCGCSCGHRLAAGTHVPPAPCKRARPGVYMSVCLRLRRHGGPRSCGRLLGGTLGAPLTFRDQRAVGWRRHGVACACGCRGSPALSPTPSLCDNLSLVATIWERGHGMATDALDKLGTARGAVDKDCTALRISTAPPRTRGDQSAGVRRTEAPRVARPALSRWSRRPTNNTRLWVGSRSRRHADPTSPPASLFRDARREHEG